MLNLPISNVEITLFGLALILWAGLLFGGYVANTSVPITTRRMPVQTRLLSSFTLVIAAWIWFAISQGTPVTLLAAWIAVGITFGFIGDVFMAEVFPIEPHVLYGMVAFGIGHVAYIIGMWMIALPHDLDYPHIAVLLMWWAIAVIFWFVFIWRVRTYRNGDITYTEGQSSRKNSPPMVLVYAALPYAILLATTAGFATSLTMLDFTFILLALGAVFFLVSDALIALRIFNELTLPFINVDDLIWLLYGPAQMLIVFGVIISTVISGILVTG